MRFLVLGPLEVSANGTVLALRRGRVRSLVHLLLLHRRMVVPAEVVADRLWPEADVQDGANAVHQLVSYLRRTLGAAGRQAVVTTPAGYRLDVADEEVDAWEFESLVQQAGAAVSVGPEAALDHAEAALRLWRGEPFAESGDVEWAAGHRARLHDLYLQAQETRVDGLLALGRHRDAAVEAQSLATAYPLREQFHAQHALALYRSGRQADALEVHRTVRRLLADELGLDPGSELRRLEQAILDQDPALDWASPSNGTPHAAPAPDNGSQAPAKPIEKGTMLPGVLPPEPLLSLIGREHDLEVAQRRWGKPGLFTVTGPAGVGKSRLLVSLVHDGVGETGVWYVDVGDIADDRHLTGVVADRLGLHQELPADPGQRLEQALAATGAGTLVLDNCDDVMDGAADLARSLLVAVPGLQVVVSSRRPLGLPGEVVHRTAPLPLPSADEPAGWRDNPAMVLFVDRARHVDDRFELDGSNVGDIVALLGLLDGLPMAIELAAGHVDVSSVPQIRRRLERHLDSLTAASTSLPTRRASLAAAIEASVRALDDGDRAFLTSLGVFPGFFDTHAASSVAGADVDSAFVHLASLVRQSLVAVEGDDRYRLLAPIRSFVAGMVERSTQAEELRTRHVDWLADVAWTAWEASRGARQRYELARLRDLLPDARIALEWSLTRDYMWGASRIGVAFAWLWTLHGLAEEGFEWLLRIKELSDRKPELDSEHSRARASLLRSLGLLANPMGRMELAREVCAEAAELALAHGDRQGAAAALLTRGVALWALDDQAQAAATLNSACELTEDEPGSWAFLAARALRARTALDSGDPEAEKLLDEAVELTQSQGERQMLGLALACKARLRLSTGAIAAAIITAEEALRVWRDINYREGEMMARNLLARCHAREGEVDLAEQCAREALTVARDTGHRGAVCESMESLAVAAAASGRRERAYLLLTVAGRERRRLGAPIPAGDRGSVHALCGQLQEALTEAAGLIEARAELTRIDDLVEQLLG